MLKVLAIGATALPLAVVSPLAQASFGTEEEARLMLQKAVGEIAAGKEEALRMFTRGEGGFRDRDLYVFCGNEDGRFTAHPTLVGQPLVGLRDISGKDIGREMYVAAKENQISEVTYQWPRPGEVTPTRKTALVTRIDDQVCAVGYYHN